MNFVVVPLIWFIGSHMGGTTVYPATIPISHFLPRTSTAITCALSPWEPSRPPVSPASSSRCV